MRRRIALLLAIGVMLLGASAWAVGSIESAPSNHPVPAAVAPAVDIHLQAGDGIGLAGTYWPGSRSGAPGIVLLHGNGSSRDSLVAGARWLSGLGYAVLTIDFRGHGESAAMPHSFGYFEARDAAASVAWLRQKQGGAAIVVIGSSLGGAAALIGEDGPVAADGLVLQAVYPDIRTAVHNRIARRLGTTVAIGLEPLLSYQSRLRLGVWPDRLSPVTAVRHFHGPVLVLGGEKDRSTPVAETRAVYDAVPGPKELWIAPGRGHNGMVVASDDEWKAHVAAFLGRHFPFGPTTEHKP